MTNNQVYILSCENASHLGGQMGTEYTTPVFSKPFSTVEKAKDYALKYNGKPILKCKWDFYKNYWYWDSGGYIFKIRLENIG